MKNFWKDLFGVVCVLFSVANIFNGGGFTFQTGTGTLDPSNVDQLIGYNLIALVWYIGAVWFIYSIIKN
ncbi:MAG: hypothetical protein AAB645_02600, partial [Patescibacteria group bacterium]